MQASNAPSKSPVPFAESGTKNTIPVNSQIGITPGAASFTDGFPPLTMTPLAAGGVPPYGADFNGILNFLSEGQRWANAGGGYTYDAPFATAIGGYPKGALILGNDGVTVWVSQADNNAVDPNAGVSAAWKALASLTSPAFLGTPTAPTPVVADNSTKLATTAFVQSVVAGVAAVPATTLVSGISRRATTPEAQGLTSSDTTLSPASLRAAFQGTNYSATFNGFQILPSGIIEQWGVVALVTLPANSASDAVVTFPMAFTANALSIAISVETPAPTQVSCSVMTDTLTTTGVTLRRGNSSTSTPWNVVVRYRVIGR